MIEVNPRLQRCRDYTLKKIHLEYHLNDSERFKCPNIKAVNRSLSTFLDVIIH